MKSKTQKKRRRWWIIPVALLAVLCIGASYVFFADMPSRRELMDLEIGNVDFQNLHDGTYTGVFEGTAGHMRDASVEVTVTGGEVSAIRVLKGAIDEAGTPVELTEGLTIDALFDRMLANRSLQVDGISSATLTSKAHLKALEDALSQAQQEQP